MAKRDPRLDYPYADLRPKGRPAMLRSGMWGAWVDSEDVREGAYVNMKTKSGKEWVTEVFRVLHRGNGGALVETVSPSVRTYAALRAGLHR